jgi:pimeloyl-ACP methyl ester carboxylesterase/quercetin dioxygenase-like cupin family protein
MNSPHGSSEPSPPRVLLRSEESKGRVALIESTMPPGAKGPPLHTHAFDETFYVLEGELIFQLGDELILAGAGEVAFAGGGAPHTFTNRSNARARFLIVCTPAGFEREFARRAATLGGVAPPAWAMQPIPEVTVVGAPIGVLETPRSPAPLDRTGGREGGRGDGPIRCLIPTSEEEPVSTVESTDGTTIAFEVAGQGPPVILVDGAFGYHGFGPNVGLVPLLADRFTAVLYDRRGRGHSGDTQPFNKHREIEDLDAVIGAVGGSAYVYGISSGAALAAEAASVLGDRRVTRLALYEPSYILDDSHPPVPEDYVDRQKQLLSEGRRGEMVALFMTDAVGLPAEMVDGMRQSPFWPTMESVAPSLIYDAAFVADNQRARPMTDELRETLQAINVPTIVIDGGATFPFLHATAELVAKTIPGAGRLTLEGQQHDVAPDAVAPALAAFFTDGRVSQ